MSLRSIIFIVSCLKFYNTEKTKQNKIFIFLPHRHADSFLSHVRTNPTFNLEDPRFLMY